MERSSLLSDLLLESLIMFRAHQFFSLLHAIGARHWRNRIHAIKKSLKFHDKLNILRHINAIITLQKYYNKLSKDLKWMQDRYSTL